MLFFANLFGDFFWPERVRNPFSQILLQEGRIYKKKEPQNL